MNPILRCLCALLGTLALAGCATAERPEIPGTLKVAVNVPPSWNLLLDDRVSDLFVDHVREIFHRQGFDRPVEMIRYVEDPARVPYLLTINLAEWRMNRIGNIECTFTADLQTPRGTKHLGIYNHTSFRWAGGIGRWGLARSFEEAAEGAISDLCRDVVRSELLPDFGRSDGRKLYSGTTRTKTSA